ncbi:hypothetical protein [Acidisoma sp. C75]
MRKPSGHPALRALLLALPLAGCLSSTKPPDTAQLPAGAFHTNGDQDVAALDAAALGFAHAIRGNPAKAAYSVAALDYLGGELNSNPRWIAMDPTTRLQLLDARSAMRGRLGISESASSQAVVDTLLALSSAYQADDQARVQSLLRSPIFTADPATVAARLDDIPYSAGLNGATARADNFLQNENFEG